MNKILLFIFLTPGFLLAQERAQDGIYNSKYTRSLDSSASVNNTRKIIPGKYAGGITIAATNQQPGFPKDYPLTVYPNPAVSDSRIVFTSGEYGHDYVLLMTSLDGKPLLQRKGITVKGPNIINLDMGRYPMGTYFIQLMLGQRREIVQFIKVAK